MTQMEATAGTVLTGECRMKLNRVVYQGSVSSAEGVIGREKLLKFSE